MRPKSSITNSAVGLEADYATAMGQGAPQEQLEDVELLEMEEVLDHLGYIQIDQNEPEDNASIEELTAGIKTFRQEVETHIEQINQKEKIFDIDSQLVEHDESDNSRLSEPELNFLNAICSLEGRFALHIFDIADIKTNPILTRILSFRLSILGLMDSPGREYHAGIDTALNNLHTWLGIKDPQEIIQHSGDVMRLSKVIVERKSYTGSLYKHIVYFQHAENRIAEKNFKASRFESRLVFLPIKSQNAYRERKRLEDIEQVMQDPMHNFVLRLVQLRLWVLGVYGARLDNDIGPLSYEAIKNLLKYLRDTSGKEIGISFQDLVTKFERKKMYALNATFLLRKVFPIYIDKYNEKSLVYDTISAKVDDLVQVMDGNQQKKFVKEIDALIKKDRKGKRRKVKMRGSNNLFGSIRLFFNKAVGWLKRKTRALFKKVINFFKRIFSYIKNGIKVLLREIKKSINHVGKTIAFVFSKRIVTTQDEDTDAMITSDFDIDFDAVTVSKEGSAKLQTLHIDELQSIALSMEKGALIIGKALYIVINALKGPLGWIKMGIRMVKLMIEHVKSKNKFLTDFTGS